MIEGLGDVVKVVIDSTGLGKLAKKDCAKCNRRREQLNKRFPIYGTRKNGQILQGEPGGQKKA